MGRVHHHAVVLNGEGEVLLSRRVVSDEPELPKLTADVLELGEDVVGAVHVTDGTDYVPVNLLHMPGVRRDPTVPWGCWGCSSSLASVITGIG
ncbi:transposase [Streptomyces sp. NPDC059176]|uniref:IS110 family transposase n=1 Tax=unclassified Streptomyces TaxID=2593676 RepID=UPI00368A8F8B